MKQNLEFKIGIFVLIAIGLLSVMVFKAGDFYLKPGYTLKLVFDYVTGVEKGSQVRLAGVIVGEIKDIHVVRSESGETRVVLDARIDQGAIIEEDAEVRINSIGLLTEKYIEILPGSPGVKPVSDGAVLVGRTPIVLEKITESGDRLIQKLERAVDSLNNVVSDKEFQAQVKGTFGHAYGTMKDLQQATEDIRDTAKSARIVMARLRDGEGTIGHLLKDPTIAKDLEALMKDLRANPWKLLKKG